MRLPFDLVVFDVGGVLVEAGRAWRDDIERAGFAMPVAWLDAFEARLLALPDPGIGAIDDEAFLARYVEASRGAFSDVDARRIFAASLIGELAGIGDVLDVVQGAGIATAVLSNATRWEWARLFPKPGDPIEFATL